MPNEYRYGSFLSSYSFFPNNIEFRIHSSKSLEKWKNVQSFQLNQLINGKFFFQQDRREILLLKYDIFSRFLYEVENFFIEISGKNNTDICEEDTIEFIISLLDKSTEKFNSIITHDHRSNFNNEFVNIWLEVHNNVHMFEIDAISKFTGLRFCDAFMKLVDLLTQVMQYSLVEIHELDAIFCKTRLEYTRENIKYAQDISNEVCFNTNTPFIVVSDFSNRAVCATGTCLVLERLKTYKKYFNFSKIYIKNYTDDFVCINLIKKIEELGFEIDYKKSLSRA